MGKDKKAKHERHRCQVCGRKIKTMAFLNTGVCSGVCEEKRDDVRRDEDA